jgi:hypothetical protein
MISTINGTVNKVQVFKHILFSNMTSFILCTLDFYINVLLSKQENVSYALELNMIWKTLKKY